MKTRMAIDDISAMVGSITKNVVNMRVTNIYDSEVNKTYILKLATPGLPKVFLLLQSGVRFHTTAYARETASALPLQFTMKLRKHLRGKRLASVTQCASDRVIDFAFGDGDQRHHLILELYAAGNIILTDHNYSILSLLRSHTYDEQVKVAVKQVYPMENAMVVGNSAAAVFRSGSDLITFIQTKSKKQYTLKQILMSKESGLGGFGPTIVEHCLVKAHLAPSLKVKTAATNVVVPLTPDEADALVASLAQAPTLLDELAQNQVTLHGEGSDASDVSDHGFIILSPTTGAFDEFTPYLYAQHEGRSVQRFRTFDMATKVDKLKKHQQDQMEAFRKTQEESVVQAQLIEQNQGDIENVLLVLRSALANGMDWKDLEDLIKQEQKNGNPVASLIHKLDLAQNRVSVLLCDTEADDADMESAVAYCVPIDLSLSALANARELYSKKKKAVVKAQKATEATDKAIEQAIKKHEKKQQAQKLQRKTLYQRRKTMWFEKFHWFITREKYMVLAGKDAQQNETLVKKYLRKGDLYVHADLHGAATCIIRNRSADANDPIPISTIEQAGCMSVCRSNAWANQVVAGAYWVRADQVSKTAPTGEYLTTGSFMIRGKKNFIPASRLEMGLAIVFRIDESSVAHHLELEALENDDVTPRAVAVVDDEKPAAAETSTVVAPKPTAKTKPAKPQPEVKAAPVVAPDDEPSSDAESPDGNGADDDAPGKKRLSAKERRDLKKARTKKDEDDAAEVKASPPPAPTEKKPKGAAPAPPVRGKKGKLKKMKKYADQDEDERLLRLAALGHVKVAELTEAGENDKEDETPANDETEDATPSEAGTSVVDDEKEAIYALHRERKAQLQEQEEEEAQNAAFLDSFTGTPLPNDLLLFAMPVCAPYSTLALYTYKVKLTPGSQKKGKAVQFAVDHFLNLKPKISSAIKTTPVDVDAATDEVTPDVDPIEAQKELIKCVPEADLVGCMVGPVKVSAPGLSTAKKGGNNKPKKAHKNKST
ncbi:hypothetical protein SPRG_07059 [Saprolegnia parasitica CBS 223.65]|uniref:Ribosome quality control complex subunit 2 n=1 Tax=Saprolegnia parasitica (strain CBS 223.65) TaxID=695850 RepID=A0A067CE61_SAPPC|nr:hypothetical protein SPRG_07059 [Saprolegnia parasitica CBS 223.65]KDO27470.1 hypothetical protein SPRG_07059 [Saprolegnia parasitica CBS 223.65]|eukprot:XP_012201908.1 hypothetical protein SPRG_07059 [Saprolegnia parasitica CBS 223.65]